MVSPLAEESPPVEPIARPPANDEEAEPVTSSLPPTETGPVVLIAAAPKRVETFKLGRVEVAEPVTVTLPLPEKSRSPPDMVTPWDEANPAAESPPWKVVVPVVPKLISP